MASVDLSSITVLAELERVGLKFEFAGEDEIRCACPFHKDDKPSCCVNVTKRLFKCHAAGCGESGDFLTFLAKVLNTTRRVVFEDLATRYDLVGSKAIDAAAIERWHAEIWAAGPLLKALHERGVTDELIRKYRLGMHGGRVTIPIPDASGQFVNVRRYLPGAPGPEKMRNMKGHGETRLFPIEQLKYGTVVVCGGEMKAVVAAAMLNKYNVGAITATAGEGNWEPAFSKLMRGKKAYVCFDTDLGGMAGAEKVCAYLRGEAAWVGKVQLPLDAEKYPHGDINDWVGREGATGKDFLGLLNSTKEWAPRPDAGGLRDDAPFDVDLQHASDATHTSARIRVRAVVAAMDTAPYVVPSEVTVVCDRAQDGCSACPAFVVTPDDNGVVSMHIQPESPGILEMVAAPKVAQREALMCALRVPQCKSVEFRPTKWCNVEDLRLSPQLQISRRTAEHVMQPAYSVGFGLEPNESYELTGRMFPHPKTQQSVLLISRTRTTKDALSTYKPTPAELQGLKLFQPEAWTLDSLQRRLDCMYDDLEANVTRIFMRRDLHLVVDLVYHSPLLLPFDGRTVKGWAEALVLGDSSQGKSETTMRLMEHYGLGEKAECKNATVAGLLGGLQQLGTRWFVTWGVIPTHDKRLVVLEELKGASQDVIAKLTDMRSSGVAEIPKIEKRRTHARTRLIALSNPRSDHPLSSYNFGVEAVKELVGGLEDVRRFDAVLLVSSAEIDAKTLNRLQRNRPEVPETYSSDLCHRLVLWAWTRELSQVRFTDAAYSAILDEATRMCSVFTELIPIVDRGSMRYKLARLSAALACRTFSCDDADPLTVVIRDCHVRYVSAFLERVYSSPVFGYADFSRAIAATQVMLQPDDVKTKVLQTPFPADFVQQMLHTNEIELRDVCDWCGWDKGEGLQLLSFLVRKHALQRAGRGYRKTPPFIRLLKQVEGSPELKLLDRPGHIKEDL